MTQFVKVRSHGGPDAIYQVGREELEANPHLYDVVGDDQPVEPPRSGKGSGVKAWRGYAAAIGVDHDSAATVEDIIAAVDDAASKPVSDPNKQEEIS
jgi:hypothetical protein